MAATQRLTLAGDSGALQQKRLRILHHATHAFFTQGYEDASLQDIAEAAGVGKVTIYRFFIDKADLFKHVMMDAARHMSDPLAKILDDDDEAADPFETLVRFAATYVEQVVTPVADGHRYFEIQKLFIHVGRRYPEVSWVTRDIFRDNIHRPVVTYFSKLLEAGVLREEEPDFLAMNFVNMLFLTDFANSDPALIPSPERIEDYARRVVGIFLNGARTA